MHLFSGIIPVNEAMFSKYFGGMFSTPGSSSCSLVVYVPFSISVQRAQHQLCSFVHELIVQFSGSDGIIKCQFLLQK
jgi:hypothetical protein